MQAQFFSKRGSALWEPRSLEWLRPSLQAKRSVSRSVLTTTVSHFFLHQKDITRDFLSDQPSQRRGFMPIENNGRTYWIQLLSTQCRQELSRFRRSTNAFEKRRGRSSLYSSPLGKWRSPLSSPRLNPLADCVCKQLYICERSYGDG